MYLTLKKTRGVKYLYLVQSVYDPVKKRSNKKFLKSFGRWEDVDEETKQLFLDQQKRKALEINLEQKLRADMLSSAVAAAVREAEQKTNGSAENDPELHGMMMPPLFYGHLALRGIWENDLDLKKCIYNLQSYYHEDVNAWSFNDLLFYLSSRKVLHPASYLNAYASKGNYFYCPWQYINQDNFYRGLDFLYEHSDTIISHAVNSYLKKRGGRVEIAFYDCTNTWFETPYDDVGWQSIRFTRRRRQELANAGFSEYEIDNYIRSQPFCDELAEELKLRQDEAIRMCGLSKDGKRQPLVMVALAMDQTGLPLDCQIFAGNISEVKTVDTMLHSLKTKYGVEDVYFVADRGINSTKVLNDLENQGFGFVVAQKVSFQKKQYREEMLEQEGYRNCRIIDGEIMPSTEPLNPMEFRFKVSTMEKSALVDAGTGEVTAAGRPRKKKLTVDCKVIYTWDRARAAKDLNELDSQIARAMKAVENKELLGNPYKVGWRSLLETQKEIAEGEDKEIYRAVGLKQKVIDDRKAVAGYAAYVYKHPLNKADQLSDIEVLAAYHRLVGIEDQFRVMKSHFSLRPVHVRIAEHIKAHCYMCFLALLMLRVLQFKLREAGVNISSNRIVNALGSAVLAPVPTSTLENISLINMGLNAVDYRADYTGKKNLQQGTNELENMDKVWEGMLKNFSNNPNNDMSAILTAVGLQPLPPFTTLTEAKARLGLQRVTNEELISYITRKKLNLISQG